MKATHKLSYVLIMILLFAIGFYTVGAQDNPPQVQLSPDKADAVTGDIVTVTVNVAGAVGVYGGSFKLNFDPQAFEVVQTDDKPVTPGPFFANEPGFALRNAVDPAAGSIEYAITLMQPAKPVDGDGVLGSFQLKALKDGPVALNDLTASFVAPEFKEVDGHLVAQKVNQITAQVQEPVVVAAQPVASDASVESSVNVAPTVEAPVPTVAPVDNTAVTMFSNPQLNAVPTAAVNPGIIPVETVNRTDKAVSIAAIVFLLVGVGLLTLSIGMYSHMRFHYTSLAGHK